MAFLGYRTASDLKSSQFTVVLPNPEALSWPVHCSLPHPEALSWQGRNLAFILLRNFKRDSNFYS